MSATYSKLKSGEWGIRVQGTVKAVDVVTVTTKSGEVKTETVAKVVWTGQGVTLCAVKPKPKAPAQNGGHGNAGNHGHAPTAGAGYWICPVCQ